MNDILQYNKYINIFNQIYDYVAVTKDKDISELVEPAKGLKKLSKHNMPDSMRKAVIINNNAMDSINEFINDECDIENMLSFSSLWQFCQFVRYAEKIVFYKNEPSNTLYIDSDMFDIKERAFQIKYKDTEIQFRLEKTDDIVNKQEFKVITLNIKRLYGKNMMNVFTIVNEDVKLNDASDQYLINTVNDILYREMIRCLKASVKELLKVYEVCL